MYAWFKIKPKHELTNNPDHNVDWTASVSYHRHVAGISFWSRNQRPAWSWVPLYNLCWAPSRVRLIIPIPPNPSAKEQLYSTVEVEFISNCLGWKVPGFHLQIGRLSCGNKWLREWEIPCHPTVQQIWSVYRWQMCSSGGFSRFVVVLKMWKSHYWWIPVRQPAP